MKNKYGLFVFFSICIVASLFAEGADTELLRQVDSLASYEKDFSAVYTFVEEKPGEGRTKTVAQVHRRDRDETYTIIIKEPQISSGQGYLKVENTLWFYDPDSRRFNYTASRDRFQNTNARNSDFTRSTLAEDYKVSSIEDVELGRYQCKLLSLEAITDEVTYRFMKIWVDEKGLIRKSEDYSLSHQLLRTTAFPSYQKVDSIYVPRQFIILDHLRGANVDGRFINEKTQVTLSNVSFSAIDDATFSKRYLERMSF